MATYQFVKYAMFLNLLPPALFPPVGEGGPVLREATLGMLEALETLVERLVDALDEGTLLLVLRVLLLVVLLGTVDVGEVNALIQIWAEADLLD